jgi:hypothetical protein
MRTKSNLHYLLDHINGADDVFVNEGGTLRSVLNSDRYREAHVLLAEGSECSVTFVLSAIDLNGRLVVDHRRMYINDMRDWVRVRLPLLKRPL